jgi:hypothetical protein
MGSSIPLRLVGLSGGRTWWAHFEFTRINIEPTILRKKIEDLRQLGAFQEPCRSSDPEEKSPRSSRVRGWQTLDF